MKRIKWKTFLIVAIITLAALLWVGEELKYGLGNGYHLERFSENGLYYVLARGDYSGGGAFDGTIQKIAATNGLVVAFVSRLARVDPNGWYVLTTKTGKIVGPLSESAVQELSGLSTSNCIAPDQFVSKWVGRR